MTVRTVAMLTAGGLAPCLSSAVGGLIERYTEVAPDVRIIAYTQRVRRAAQGRVVEVTAAGAREGPPAAQLRRHARSATAGSSSPTSPTASSAAWSQEGQDPLHVAAEQLTADGVDVLHTIGGDDTNTTAADLAAYLHENDYELTVVGLPKTIDNDVVPDPAVARRLDRRRAGRGLRPEHHRRAHLEPADAHRPRGHGPQLRLADRGHRARRTTSWVAEQDFVPASATTRAAGTSTRSSCPSARSTSTPRPTGCAPSWTSIGCVNVFLSEGAGVAEIVAEMEAARRGGAARPVRPREARHGQPGRLVRQAVRRAARRREDDGAEVGLLRPLGRGQRPRPRADQGVHRPRRRLRAARRDRRRRPRRGARRRAAGDRVPADQGRQGVRRDHPWFADLLEAIGQG